MATEKLSTPIGAATADRETNWLDGDHSGKWKTVTLKGDMSDPKERDKKEKIIRAYIRGWLELYNDENNTAYKVKKVEIRNNYGGDTRFTVKAFIDPPPSDSGQVEGNGHDHDPDGAVPIIGPFGGSHLIPEPPPPPDDV